MKTDYEQARLDIIARNKARLQALGVTAAVQDLTNTIQAPKQPQKQKSAAQKRFSAPAGTVRRSKRLRVPDEDAENTPEDNELSDEAIELAKFQIDGTCPKCGKVVTKGHASHLENCMGTTKRSRSMKEYTIGELVALEADKIEKQEKKLLELELGGLVKVDDEKAVFLIVGSKGRQYEVELSDTKRKCQCIDHRIRKHDCKHIKLLLRSLGIADTPEKWLEATKQRIRAQADTS